MTNETTEAPNAYLITFHTYGTWLHGGARGSVDPSHNRFQGELVPADSNRYSSARSRMKQPALRLGGQQRPVVREAIEGVCAHRGWELLALNVRTTHVHAVVIAAQPPERVMNDFKAWSTRRLREAGVVDRERSIWARHGSTKYLWNQPSVDRAIRYVIEGQGVDLD